MLILLFLWLHEFTLGAAASKTRLKRRPRSIAVGSVYIENETDDLLKIQMESNLVISAFKARAVVGKNKTSSHGIGFTQDGFTTIRPRGHKLVKFTVPAISGNSLVKCSVFTTEMVKIIDSETLENSYGYKIVKLQNQFLLEPIGNFFE